MVRASDQRLRGGRYRTGSIPSRISEIFSLIPSPITKQLSLQSNNILSMMWQKWRKQILQTTSSNEGCIPLSLKKMKFKTYKGNINAWNVENKINTSFQECSLFLFDQIIYDNLVLNVVALFVVI